MKICTHRYKWIVYLFLASIAIVASAQSTNLNGVWKYSFPGGEMVMEISAKAVVIDGESYAYKIEGNNLMVSDGYSYTPYPFLLNGNRLTLTFPDGSQIDFIKDQPVQEKSNPLQQAAQKQTGSTSTDRSSTLSGKWVYKSDEGEIVLEFLTGNQLLFNGETTDYQVNGEVIMARTDYGWVNYPYVLSSGKLLITFPDGTQLPFVKAASATASQGKTTQPTGAGGPLWQLQGSLCYWSGSSSSYSSYSRTEKLTFDGKGNFIFGKEGSFSGDAGLTYSGNPNVDGGTYRIEGNKVTLTFRSGEVYQLDINIRQDDGRITELMYQGKLYAVSLCE
jgi:hypothetical protein